MSSQSAADNNEQPIVHLADESDVVEKDGVNKQLVAVSVLVLGLIGMGVSRWYMKRAQARQDELESTDDASA